MWLRRSIRCSTRLATFMHPAGAALLGSQGYEAKQGLLMIPAQAAQDLSPWLVGASLEALAFGALTMLRAEEGEDQRRSILADPQQALLELIGETLHYDCRLRPQARCCSGKCGRT